MASLLLRNATLYGPGAAGTVDIRVSDGTVTELAAALAGQPGEECIDCEGGLVLPGLTDHHLHLYAMAAARTSVRCGPPAVTSRADLAAALNAATQDEHGWIRGAGYIESVAGDLGAAALDALRADLPVRIQHRSGALWMLNTAALVAIGLLPPGEQGHPGVERDETGRPTAGSGEPTPGSGTACPGGRSLTWRRSAGSCSATASPPSPTPPRTWPLRRSPPSVTPCGPGTCRAACTCSAFRSARGFPPPPA